jgi:tetratricopeptide (TPR) repeat protein
VPPLPAVKTSGFLPSIARAIDTAYRDVSAKPDDGPANGRLGMVLHAHDQFASARVCFQRAEAFDPGSADWTYYLALAQLADGQSSPAAASFARFRSKRPDYFPAILKRAEALQAAGEPAEAAFREALQVRPDDPAALFGLGRALNDVTYFEKALAAFPRYGAAIFALAQAYRRAGRVQDSERLMASYPQFKTFGPPLEDPLQDAILALNAGPSPLIRRAQSLESQGQLAPAVDLHIQALQLDPQLVQAHVNLISLYGRLRDYPAAERYYRSAIALNPNAHEAYYNFGVLCAELGRRVEAKAAFERAVGINPGYAEAHNNLGALAEQTGQLDAATRHFLRAVDLQPGFALARFHLGRIYANQRKWPQAIQQFERIGAPDEPSTPTYLYAFGATLARSGNVTRAVEILGAAKTAAERFGQADLSAAIARDLQLLGR